MRTVTSKDATSNTKTFNSSTPSSGAGSGNDTLFHGNMALPEGGASVYRNLDLGNTGQLVKTGAATLYGGIAFNDAGSTPSGTLKRFLKIYDKASAASSSDTPVMTIPLEDGVPTQIILPSCGVAFTNGISVRASTLIADANTGAPGTNEVVVNLFYA